MKRHILILLSGFLCLTSSCSKDNGDIPPGIEIQPEPSFTYYDGDDYDPAAYIAAYKGTPYKGPHHIPGTLEAEDFDEGGEGVAWHESDTKTGNAAYRGSTAVEVTASSASNGYHIGDVQPGEWMCYTLEVTQEGTYSIDTYIVKGDGSSGTFYFEVDGRGASRSMQMPQGGWEDFSQKVTAAGIQLTAGKHILKYYANDPGNVDRFVFTRTGDLEHAGSDNSGYPISLPMGNPLFVDFPSPMYNSWLKGRFYSADASAHVWNVDGKEVLYVYCSHDMEPAQGCDRMDRYHVFSTEDMKTWTDHGEIMNAVTVRKNLGWGTDGFMWAPDCAYNPGDKRYYFYFPHPATSNWNDTWRIGVAVSERPDGGFRLLGYVDGMPSYIDPCVFVDDDGQPYIYNGGGGKAYACKLRKDDWARLDGTPQQMTGLSDFHEATWIHKYKGRYYLSHSDNHRPEEGGNHMRYAVSDSPLGPWTPMGIYMYPTGIDTNHGSIVQFKGQWYAFYHTGNFSGEGTLRSVCVDPLTVNGDGTLEIVRNWGTAPGGTSPGAGNGQSITVEGEAYNKGGYHYGYFTRNEARTAPEEGKDGNRTYVSVGAGEWVRYSFVAQKSGPYTVEAVLSAAENNTRVFIGINGSHPQGDLTVKNGWNTLRVEHLEASEGEAYVEIRVTNGKANIDQITIR